MSITPVTLDSIWFQIENFDLILADTGLEKKVDWLQHTISPRSISIKILGQNFDFFLINIIFNQKRYMFEF